MSREATLAIAIARLVRQTPRRSPTCSASSAPRPHGAARGAARGLDAEPRVWLVVAATGDRHAGLAGLRVLTLSTRDEPVGRLIVLVVGEHARGRCVGRTLVAHVEERARPRAVQLDVSSSDRREDAQASTAPRLRRRLAPVRQGPHAG